MKKFLTSHILFILLIIILAVYLGIKTFPENGWGGWLEGIGDAATLLSTKHWANDGFIYSKFLFLPMGYSKTVRYFDELEMRHHARGTVTGGLIGRRLYYTHYPAGYLIPYGILAKFGFEQRYWFRLLALFFSFSALILMYCFFNLIASRLVAFFAALYYGISTIFLDYADSLANQPIDDLFRFAILVFSVLAVRKIDDYKKYILYNIFIWLAYFVLASSSYDSTFFIFIWLLGLDIIMFKKLFWKKWLFFATAPAAAFALQMLQNWWYLGNWREVWLDAIGASLAKTQTGNIFLHIKDVFYTFSLATGLNILGSIILIFVLVLVLWKMRKPDLYFSNFFSLLTVLFLAGSAYPFIFVGSGGFSYQGRQMMPFFAFLIGLATVLFIQSLNFKEKKKTLTLIILIFALMFFWGTQVFRTAQYVYGWPNNKANEQVIELGESLKLLRNRDSVVFYLGDRLPLTLLTEYYLDMPFLFFKDQSALVKDYVWLKNRSEYQFDAFIISDKKNASESIRNLMQKNGVNIIEESKFIQGEHVFKIIF